MYSNCPDYTPEIILWIHWVPTFMSFFHAMNSALVWNHHPWSAMSIYTFLTPYSHVYGGFLKWWYPQNTPKWSFLVGKPMVVGYHHFRKPPYLYSIVYNIYTRVICHVSPRYYRQLTVFNISPPPLSFFSLHQLFFLGWFQEVRNSDTKTSVPWSCSCRSFLLDDGFSSNLWKEKTTWQKNRQF